MSTASVVLRVLLGMFGLPVGSVAYGVGIIGLFDQWRAVESGRSQARDILTYSALCCGGVFLVGFSILAIRSLG